MQCRQNFQRESFDKVPAGENEKQDDEQPCGQNAEKHYARRFHIGLQIKTAERQSSLKNDPEGNQETQNLRCRRGESAALDGIEKNPDR
jgi:hypothetical protein